MMKHEAIYKLHPNVITIRGDEAFDVDENVVAYDEAAVQALMASEAYKDKRAAEYPSIPDQFDLLYHGGYDAWKAAIDAVKNKYPKG
jgi:rhodanese-related sulfurtransferase